MRLGETKKIRTSFEGLKPEALHFLEKQYGFNTDKVAGFDSEISVDEYGNVHVYCTDVMKKGKRHGKKRT